MCVSVCERESSVKRAHTRAPYQVVTDSTVISEEKHKHKCYLAEKAAMMREGWAIP